MVLLACPFAFQSVELGVRKAAASADDKAISFDGGPTMRMSVLFPACCALGILASAGPALGQMWRSHGYPYGYGGWGDGAAGALGSLSATSQYNTTRDIQSANKLAGQNIAAQQSAAMQSNIQNTMMSQAQSQTQNLMNQRQANKDWWFQVQQQQVAQRQSAGGRMPPSMPPPGFEPATIAAAAPAAEAAPKAADDVMQWPAVLQDARFAALRSAIEAPYRRTPGKLSYPTREQYLAMLPTIEQMRSLLDQMTADMTAREYLDAQKFLELIARQAQEQAKKKE